MRVYHDRLVTKEDRDAFIAYATRIGNTFQALAKDSSA